MAKLTGTIIGPHGQAIPNAEITLELIAAADGTPAPGYTANAVVIGRWTAKADAQGKVEVDGIPRNDQTSPAGTRYRVTFAAPAGGWRATQHLNVDADEGTLADFLSPAPDALPEVGTLPAGGTPGQFLAKASPNDWDAQWTSVAPGGGGTPASTVVAETTLDGAASVVGTATAFAREDHTHGTPAMPSAADVGADPAGTATNAVSSHAGESFVDGHEGVTLAELNDALSDATLDDSSATRPPASHNNSAHSETYLTAGAADALYDPAGAAGVVAGDLTAHEEETTGAHPASAISFADTAENYDATDVEAALAEVADAVLTPTDSTDIEFTVEDGNLTASVNEAGVTQHQGALALAATQVSLADAEELLDADDVEEAVTEIADAFQTMGPSGRLLAAATRATDFETTAGSGSAVLVTGLEVTPDPLSGRPIVVAVKIPVVQNVGGTSWAIQLRRDDSIIAVWGGSVGFPLSVETPPLAVDPEDEPTFEVFASRGFLESSGTVTLTATVQGMSVEVIER